MADPVSVVINIAAQVAIAFLRAALMPKSHTEGPRLDDRQITVSTYGDEIPFGYGTVIIGGNVIWGKEIEEVAVTTDIGKGNPFSLGTHTTYYYYASFAVGISRREISEVLRIYADGKLIFDKEGGTLPDDDPNYQIMEDLNFTVYKGTQTQLPDPLIEADVGEGNCPAFRGTAYIVFNRMPLANFSNRVPQLRFVVAYASDNLGKHSVAWKHYRTFSGLESFSYDPKRKLTYAVGFRVADNAAYVSAIDPANGRVLLTKSLVDLVPGWTNGGPTTNIYAGTGDVLVVTRDTGDRLVLLDKETFALLDTSYERAAAKGSIYNDQDIYFASWGPFNQVNGPGIYADDEGPAGLYVGMGGVGTCTGAMCEVTYADGSTHSYIVSGHKGGNSGFWKGGTLAVISLTDLNNCTHHPSNPVGTEKDWGQLGIAYRQGMGSGNEKSNFYDGFDASIEGQRLVGFTYCYVLMDGEVITQTSTSGQTSDLKKTLLRVKVAPSGNCDHTEIYNIPAERFHWYANMTFCPDEDVLIIIGYSVEQAGNPVYTCALNVDPTLGSAVLLWEKFDSPWEFTANQDKQDVVRGGTLVKVNGTTKIAYEFNVVTGEIINTFDLDAMSFTLGDAQAWNATYGNIIWDGESRRLLTRWRTYYLEDHFSRGSESLQTVVEDITLRSKLEAADIDATALATKSVRGYTIARSMSYRAALEPLSATYNFYGVEKDGKIVFDFHDATTDIVIPEDDLVRSGFESIFEEARGQELETPRALYVNFRSPDEDDMEITQGARRISVPAATMGSVGEATYELPLYLTADEGAEVAERLLYEQWVHRESVKFRLPPRYLRTLANDTLEVTAEGRTESIRAQAVSVGVDLNLEIEGVVVDGEVYVARLPGVAGQGSPGYPGNTVKVYAKHLQGWMLDSPLLRDGDGPTRANAVLYFASGRGIATTGSFPGAVLLTQYNGTGWASRAGLSKSQEMTWGVLQETPPDIPDPMWNAVQEASLEVQMMRGADQLSSVTQADMIGNGANAAMLIRSTGEVEIIHFRDVYENSDSTFTLHGLMRGQRGTDQMATDYGSLTYFLLLDAAWVTGYYEDISRDEQSISWKVVPAASSAEGTTKSQTLRLRSLMPYAPAHVKMYMDDPSAGNRTIYWQRRTRQSGEWADKLAAVPLNEDSESYEVDILSGTGGSVLRTLTTTVPSVVYTADQADVDFGTDFPNPLYVRVYQMSAQVGRGFSYEAELTEE